MDDQQLLSAVMQDDPLEYKDLEEPNRVSFKHLLKQSKNDIKKSESDYLKQTFELVMVFLGELLFKFLCIKDIGSPEHKINQINQKFGEHKMELSHEDENIIAYLKYEIQLDDLVNKWKKKYSIEKDSRAYETICENTAYLVYNLIMTSKTETKGNVTLNYWVPKDQVKLPKMGYSHNFAIIKENINLKSKKNNENKENNDPNKEIKFENKYGNIDVFKEVQPCHIFILLVLYKIKEYKLPSFAPYIDKYGGFQRYHNLCTKFVVDLNDAEYFAPESFKKSSPHPLDLVGALIKSKHSITNVKLIDRINNAYNLDGKPKIITFHSIDTIRRINFNDTTGNPNFWITSETLNVNLVDEESLKSWIERHFDLPTNFDVFGINENQHAIAFCNGKRRFNANEMQKAAAIAAKKKK